MLLQGNAILNRILFLLLSLFSFYSYSLNFVEDKSPDLGLMKNFKASELCAVSEKTHQYLMSNIDDEFAVKVGDIFANKVTLPQVKETLTFICNIYREDVRAKRQSRLHNTEFLAENFTFYRWMPDTKTAQHIARKSNNAVKTRLLNNIPDDQIFLTKYYTKMLDGSPVKTEHYTQALYAIPFDEEALSLKEADKNKTSTRFTYTRQAVISGALLKKNLAKPLVWITEEALHDVLLQGTGVLQVDGKIRYFNVHRNNGIAYDYSIGKREQARYWYFAEVPSIMGYGKTLDSKIAVNPHVTFAGNVKDLGLGKLFLVSFEQEGLQVSRLGVLADQGGAFDNNFFQLDLLVDSYKGWEDYHAANKTMPDYAKAWLLIKK